MERDPIPAEEPLSIKDGELEKDLEILETEHDYEISSLEGALANVLSGALYSREIESKHLLEGGAPITITIIANSEVKKGEEIIVDMTRVIPRMLFSYATKISDTLKDIGHEPTQIEREVKLFHKRRRDPK